MPIFIEMVRGKIYEGLIKAFFDVIAAFGMLVLLVIPLMVVLILMALDLKRFPIFMQSRVGKDEKVFSIYKIRTMKIDDDEQSATRLGKLLRSLSVDELPQLVNVLKRDMSFIGPRPLLTEYLPYYNESERDRHNAKPGLTGWAQVNGRNEIDWEERMKLDVYYVTNLSLVLDFKIIFLTLRQIVMRDRTPYKSEPTIKFSDYASKR